MIGDRFATPPGALRVLQTDGLGPAVSASVTLTSDRPISGVVIFSGSAGVAGVSASGWVNRWTAPVRMDADQGIATGVAVVNRWDVPVEVSLSLPDGTLGAEATIQLPPRGRRAAFLDELPWQSTGAEPLDLSQFRGLLTADGDLWDISGTVLQVRRGRLATLPVAPRW